jgi:hypothetical protein
MWGIASKSNPLRDRMVLAAPEIDPHRFVQRLLRSSVKSSGRPFKASQVSPRSRSRNRISTT